MKIKNNKQYLEIKKKYLKMLGEKPTLTIENIDLIVSIFEKITNFESFISTQINNKNKDYLQEIFFPVLQEKEAWNSTIIDGLKVSFEDTLLASRNGFYDFTSWKIQNLINLYRQNFTNVINNSAEFSIEWLQKLHFNLYKISSNHDYSIFDPTNLILKLKPSVILDHEGSENYMMMFDNERNYSIKSTNKFVYLQKLLKILRQQMKNNNKVEKLIFLIKFHPLFEAVYPFAYGNGQIGRLLLTNLFHSFKLTKWSWIFFSDELNKNQKKYKQQINQLSSTDNWAVWINFFLKILLKTIDISFIKIKKINDLYEKTTTGVRLKKLDLIILKKFFKFPTLTRKKIILETIKLDPKKYYQMNVYRSFNKIIQLLNITPNDNNDYCFYDLLKILLKK